MRKILDLSVLLFFALAHFSLTAQTPPLICPWTDPRLPIKDGLAVWLDATTIAAAAKYGNETVPSTGQQVQVLHDGSGHGRDFVQPTEKSRPTWNRVGDGWTLRFDGEDDHLRSIQSALPASGLTVVLVAAPHQNPGDFRGLISANAPGRRDYESGFTIDLGPGPTTALDQINVEGRGFGGASDLLDRSHTFGTLHVFQATVDPQARKVRLMVDGASTGQRAFESGALALQELTLGARFYTNGPGDQIVRGHLATDIAEVLVYERVLPDKELEELRLYLENKHASVREELPKQLKLPEAGTPLVKVVDPPIVQMLMPGFRVVELPVSLTNVNNLRFRSDGTLVALGYNGDLNLLRDTNGDGIEDHTIPFWKNQGSLRGPMGMQLTPPGYARGTGVFVPSKGKVSLIVDTDQDDHADEEIVVASGWQEIAQNVDAVGITMDAEGAIYFGLGTANYANAYLIDEKGKAAYDLSSDRGTVQRISPDLKLRETICTGVRFPIAFAINRHGDLFCTEQEGATWLANGNPLDELLHIRKGRHYGFPPRHPQHNPDVIDEPSTFDYSPQHQSTCGLVFNEPQVNGKIFGPTHWTGDAIVCGESRGKLWRTKLVKTPTGYIAASELFACLQMLTVDACVAPNGDLVVACHSGPPDWGTGPAGQGKLFRIQFTDRDQPQPVAVWPESANEIRIAFDRPLDPSRLQHLADAISVEHGAFVRSGDRFENLIPPYAVVQRQLLSPRHSLSIAGASISNDLRTMIISTSAMKMPDHFAIRLPTYATGHVSRPELTMTELDFGPYGVQVRWTPEQSSGAGHEVLAGWIPHLDLAVSQKLTQGSPQHDALWKALAAPGVLELRTQLDLKDILRPAVQPGSKIDYSWPLERVVATLKSSSLIACSTETPDAIDGILQVEDGFQISTSSDRHGLVSVNLKLRTGSKNEVPQIAVFTATNEDSTARPIPLHRMQLPWITGGRDQNTENQTIQVAELEGGNWGKGRRVFFSESAGCFKCHAVGNQGPKIGPSLANLIHRDYASVLRDIVHPSFAINPDYTGHIITMDDGQVLTGVLREEKGALIIGDNQGNSVPLERSRITGIKPSSVSIMPVGLQERLTPEQLRDLMTYLLTPAPRMPLDSPLKAPPIRTEAEVSAALAGSEALPKSLRTLNVVLVAGKKDHGPGEHDYPAWQRQWSQLLTASPNINVLNAWDFPDDEQLQQADLLLFFQKGTWDDHRAHKLDAYLERGGGAVYMHWAVNGDARVADFSTRIGLASQGGKIRYRHGPLTLNLHNTDHPILRNLQDLQLYDESYWLLTGDTKQVILLASSLEDDAPQPQVWTYQKGKGRVFVSIPGHYNWTFDDPLFRILLFRGIAWSANEPLDRFNDLVRLGARIRD